MRRQLGLVLSFLMMLPGVSLAGIITFDGLTGSERDPFSTPYTEGSFEVTPITGRWLESHWFGNPVPAIQGDTFTASLEVSELSIGLFSFNAIDLASGTVGTSVSYTLEGLLAGMTVFSTSGTVPYPFVTISSPSSATIDTLRLSMVRDQAEGYAVDNINANPVPEPSTLAIWCVGTLCVAIWQVRRASFRRRV